MKKFCFRLESYLKVCLHREEAEKMRLHELVAELHRLRKECDRLVQEHGAIVLEFRGKRVLPVYEAEWFLRRIDFLERTVRAAHFKVVEMESRVSEQRERLIAARRRRKVVDRLRERRLAQHEFETSKALQNEMDDIHLQLLARQLSQ